MAETIISPGVFTRENDLSFVTPAPAEAGTGGRTDLCHNIHFSRGIYG